MLKNTKRFLIISCLAACAPITSIAGAATTSSAIPENPMVDPTGPAMTSTGLNRAQETTIFQGLMGGVVLSTGTTSPDDCHTVTLSHQQFFCHVASQIHYAIYPRT